MPDPEDPVREELRGNEDLYDVATWEERTGLDRLAVRVHEGLHVARNAALVAVAIVLFAGLFGLALVIIQEEPVLAVFSLVSVLPALVLMGYLWYGDPTTREPIDALAITFILAVLFATFAAYLNSVFRQGFEAIPVLGIGLYFFVVVGPVEESVKWLAIRMHAYGRDSFQTVVDGVVYGAVAGLGFAAIENLVYILQAYQDVVQAGAGAPLQFAAQAAFGRAFVGPGHVLFSATAGYYLGLAKFNPGKRGPIVVKGLLIAAFLHGLYNTAVTYVPFTNLSFVAFVLAFDGLLLLWLLQKVARYEAYYDQVNGQPATVAGDAGGVGSEPD